MTVKQQRQLEMTESEQGKFHLPVSRWPMLIKPAAATLEKNSRATMKTEAFPMRSRSGKTLKAVVNGAKI
jgi:hypothetical protein